jgi:exosortase
MFTALRRLRQALLSSPKESLAGAAALAALLWAFGPVLAGLLHRWSHDSRYSHGWLVPLFSLYLLWSRRDRLTGKSPAPSWWGLPLLLAGLALAACGSYLYFDWLNAVALLPCLAGLAVLLGGRAALAWAWPALAFLVFMLPLPFRLETALAGPLQRVATLMSTYALQTVGFAAFSEGNIIRMGAVRIGVVEACSGLSMLLIFFALSTAFAVVVRRPLWERLLLAASAVPIAVLANVTRITVTGVLHKVAGGEVADYVFHDLAGWLMMPLALGMLWLELRLLSWVLVPRPVEEKPLFRFGVSSGPAARTTGPVAKDAGGKRPNNGARQPAPVARP